MSDTPWLTVKEAAARARMGTHLLYREIRNGRLKAARIGGRGQCRLLAEWVDAWLVASSEPELVGAGKQR